MDALMDMEVELTLTIAELVDLIEAGAIAETCSGYEPPIMADLRKQFSDLAGQLGAAVEEV